MAIAGTAFGIFASAIDHNVHKWHDLWTATTDPLLQKIYADNVETLQNRRVLQHGLGLTGLIVGGAAIVTGIAFLATLPEVPDAPKKPRIISFTPQLGPSFAGARVQM